MRAVDFAYSPAGYIESLPGLGIEAVGRYSPYRGDQGKGLTSAEYQRIKDAGLKMWLYTQVFGTESKLGFEAGVAQAHLALESHNLVPELPPGIAFYFASDYDVSFTGMAVQHFRGINSVLPVERIGVYGDTELINALYSEGLITYSCLAGASSWSTGPRPERLTMEQFPSTNFHGTQVDPVTIFAEDFGQTGGLSVEDKERLDRLEGLIGGFGIAKDPAAYIASGYDVALLTFGEEALVYAAEKQWSAFLGVGLARQEAAHTHEPSAGLAPGTKFTSEVIP